METRPAERYGQLDALRALAALTVFLGHCVGMLQPAPYSHGPVNWFMHSPLRIAIAGHQAVIFFFVLSGFVLSLGFYRRKTAPASFVVNRIFRLYPSYLCATLLVVILHGLIPVQPLSGLSDWINGFWLHPLTLGQWWPALTMLADGQGFQLNPTAWSLIIEMRISLLFPLIMILLLRFSSFRCLVAGAILGCLAAIPSSSQTDLFATIEYGFFFLAGAVMGRHKDELIGYARSLSPGATLGLLGVAVLLYTQLYWLAPASRLHVQPIDDLITGLAASILTVLALGSPAAAQVLPEPLRQLGKGAYSFYLYHFPVLLALAHLLIGHLAIGWIWLLALVVSGLLATLVYRVIEVPSIAVGHFLARRLEAGHSHADLRRAAA